MEQDKKHVVAAPVQSQPADKKVKITFEEYQKISVMICEAIQELEREGQDSVPQGEIVNKIAMKIVTEEGIAPSVEKMGEFAKKIQNCI